MKGVNEKVQIKEGKKSGEKRTRNCFIGEYYTIIILNDREKQIVKIKKEGKKKITNRVKI